MHACKIQRTIIKALHIKPLHFKETKAAYLMTFCEAKHKKVVFKGFPKNARIFSAKLEWIALGFASRL